MAKTRNRHNAAFVVGSVLGGVAGAAIALWKTPYSGVELRERITGGTSTTTGSGATVTAPGSGAGAAGTEPRFSSKLLSSVENTLAPVVGVKLGKTANEGPVTTAPVPPATGAGTTEPPAFVDRADVAPTGSATGTGFVEPGTASPELAPEGIGHAATTDELTTPQVEVTPEALKEEQGEMKPFPKLGGDEPLR